MCVCVCVSPSKDFLQDTGVNADHVSELLTLNLIKLEKVSAPHGHQSEVNLGELVDVGDVQFGPSVVS